MGYMIPDRSARFYRLGTLAVVLAFAGVVGAFWRAPEHVPVALGTFAAVASLALAGGGAEGVARNWAGQHEPTEQG